MQSKQELRKQILTQRKNLDPDISADLSHKISAKIIEIIKSNNIKVIHSYLPIQMEVDTKEIIEFCLNDQRRVICPKTEENKKLTHLYLTNLNNTKQGLFNTRYPADAEIAKESPDLILVPAVAFDRNLNRLGYGAGYYDHFLAIQNAKKIGLAYQFQIVDSIESESHDIQMDEIVSETVHLK